MSNKAQTYVEKVKHYIRHTQLFPSVLPRLHTEIEIKGASFTFPNVQLDGSIVKNLDNTSTTSKSLSITVGNNPNRALVVAVMLGGPVSQGETTSSVTGAANVFTRMTEVGTSINQDSNCATFISLNPNVGNNTITANLSHVIAGMDVLIVIYSLYNVDQSTGYYTNNKIAISDTGANPSSSITPNSINSFFIDCLVGGSSPSSETQTLAFSITGAYQGNSSQYKAGPLANLNPLTFGWTIGGNSGHSVIEIKGVRSASGTISESVSISDTTTKTTGVPISDNILFSQDKTTTIRTTNKSITDTISISDTISKQDQKNIFETVLMVDTTQKSIMKIISDTVSMIDIISLTKTIIKTINDNIQISDLAGQAKFQSISDNATIQDSLFKNIQKTLNDPIILTDLVSKSIVKTVSDNPNIIETLFKTVNKTNSDNINLIDNISKGITKNIIENISLMDNTNKAINFSILDNEILIDSVSKSIKKSIIDNSFINEIITTLIQIVYLSQKRSIKLNNAIQKLIAEAN